MSSTIQTQNSAHGSLLPLSRQLSSSSNSSMASSSSSSSSSSNTSQSRKRSRSGSGSGSASNQITDENSSKKPFSGKSESQQPLSVASCYPLPRGAHVNILSGPDNSECIIVSNNGTKYLVEVIGSRKMKKFTITRHCKNVTLISLPVDFERIAIRANETVGPPPPHGPWELRFQSPTLLAMMFADFGRDNNRVAVVGVVGLADENQCNTCYQQISIGKMFVQSACAVALHGCFDTNGKRVNSRDPYWRVYCCTKKCIDLRTCPPRSKFQYVGKGTKNKTINIVNEVFQ